MTNKATTQTVPINDHRMVIEVLWAAHRYIKQLEKGRKEFPQEKLEFDRRMNLLLEYETYKPPLLRDVPISTIEVADPDLVDWCEESTERAHVLKVKCYD